jgi:protein TonB
MEYAKRPKVKYLTANTREYAYAAYMRGWSDRVERVGNLNYPEEARRRGLHGNVLLTVVLNLDGSIKSIDVIQSSGYKTLDDAAKLIVRLAAPFPPAPHSGDHIDELNITRTWQFQPNNVLQTR